MTRQIANLDFGFGINGESQRLGICIRALILLGNVVKNGIGLLNLFQGLDFLCFFRR